MTFLAPFVLLLLVAVAALAGAYVYLQQRRRHYAVKFANLDLLASVAPKRPGWRRHLPAAVVALTMVFLILGLAKPVHESPVASEQKIIMLTIDVSQSMEATDVAPTRLAAAISAAQTFVDGLPAGVDVGLTRFASSADLMVAPTQNHQALIQALGELAPADGTATGDGIITSLQAIKSAQTQAGVDQSSPTKSAAIILLSDGAQHVGTPLPTATEQAVQAGVPISTITFGTPTGTVTLDYGQVVPVPPDPDAMAAVAKATGGTAFDAASADQLNEVYTQIQGEVGTTTQLTDLWPWFIGIALLLLMAAALASMIWSGRFL